MLVTSNGAEINQKRICRYLAYSADYPPPARILSLIAHAHHPIKPEYPYTTKNEGKIHV